MTTIEKAVLYTNLYSPTSGSKERNIQTYKNLYGDIGLPLLIATAILKMITNKVVGKLTDNLEPRWLTFALRRGGRAGLIGPALGQIIIQCQRHSSVTRGRLPLQDS